MNKKQIEYMANRFLSWNLPPDFDPDGGCNFTRIENLNVTGTNLLDARQAEDMVSFMILGLPDEDRQTSDECYLTGIADSVSLARKWGYGDYADRLVEEINRRAGKSGLCMFVEIKR